MPFPLVGNFPSFMFYKRWEDKFVEWKEKHGAVYTIWLGFQPFVMINDYETVVKLFVNESDVYSDRAHIDGFNKLTGGGNFGVIQTSGNLWTEQRRTSIKILRDFGMGKNAIQEKILAEVETICDGISQELKTGNAEIDVNKYTDIAVGSVINSLIFGYRFTENGKADEFYKLKDLLNETMKYFMDPLFNFGMHNELHAKLPFIRNRLLQFKRPFCEIMKFIKSNIDKHKRNNDYESDHYEPKDFVDAYQIEMVKANKLGTKHYFSDDQCVNIAGDLFAAGQETTSTTVQWAVGYLICNLAVQNKMQDEFDAVIGSERHITLADKSSLPYFNATMMEIQRHVNLLAINLPHAVARDVKLTGFLIKKGTTVVPQISVIMADPKNFLEPKKFMPERFIDEKGQFVNNERVMPFGIGKRSCLGEGLARAELFLILANLFNQFKFFSASEPPTLERYYDGGSPMCKPYNCCVVKRF